MPTVVQKEPEEINTTDTSEMNNNTEQDQPLENNEEKESENDYYGNKENQKTEEPALPVIVQSS